MNASDLAQVLVTGIAAGSIYTLMGMGLFITYLTTKALNFGQGDFLMIAAFLSMSLAMAGIPLIAAIPAVFLVLAGLGILLERVAIRPLSTALAGSAGSLAWILTTLGFGMLLQNTATIVWGKSSFYSPPLFSSGDKKVVNLFGAGFYLEELVVAGVALLVLAALYWFLFRTRAGKEIAAVAFDKPTAALLGINVRRTVVISYVMMALLAATSGVLAGPILLSSAGACQDLGSLCSARWPLRCNRCSSDLSFRGGTRGVRRVRSLREFDDNGGARSGPVA